uniref:D-alanyl-D-alanine carboxypeptidase family protein n=1 Tax=Streptococcus suis TaxID=1307 RepID=UPI001379C9D5
GENPEALAAFQRLIADMQALGFGISNNYSGFRSYETQASLYQSYVNQEGQAAADTYSARAGYSEHQTGLAFDLLDTSGNLLEEPNASL